MAGWHHWLDVCESEWTLGDGDGQGGLACCDSWGHKRSGMTEWLNWTELNWMSPGNEPWANNFLSFPFFCTVSCLEDGMRSHRLLQFPVASVSNYHQRGGLKQHRLTLLLFWRSEVWDWSQWAKAKVMTGLVPFEGSGRRIQFLDFFSFLMAAAIPWLVAPSCIFKGHHSYLSFHHHIVFSSPVVTSAPASLL